VFLLIYVFNVRLALITYHKNRIFENYTLSTSPQQSLFICNCLQKLIQL